MFLLSWVTRSTLTPGSSSISYRVTVGPRVKPATVASTLNCSNTSCRSATTLSLALVLALCGDPGRSSADGGSW